MKARAKYAAERGWTYSRSAKDAFRKFTVYPFVRSGMLGLGGVFSDNDGTSKNLFTGTHRGVAFKAFDYVYQEGPGEGKNNVAANKEYLVAYLTEKVTLPDFWIGPEEAISFVRSMLGSGTDLQVGNQRFDMLYKVAATDNRAALEILHPQMVEQILRGPGPSWGVNQGYLMAVGSEKVNGDNTQAMLDELISRVALIPPHVWQNYSPSSTIPHSVAAQ